MNCWNETQWYDIHWYWYSKVILYETIVFLSTIMITKMMNIFKILVDETNTKTKIKMRRERNKNQRYFSRDENIWHKVWHIILSVWQILRTFVHDNPYYLFMLSLILPPPPYTVHQSWLIVMFETWTTYEPHIIVDYNKNCEKWLRILVGWIKTMTSMRRPTKNTARDYS